MIRCKRLHVPAAFPLLALTFLLLSAVAAQAQSSRLVATIPFAFYAGEMLMPAGDYEVERVVNGVLKISSLETPTSMMFSTIGVSQANGQRSDGKLIFNKYHDDYLLTEMWWPDRTDGRKTVPSTLERELARTLRPVRVTVAVR